MDSFQEKRSVYERASILQQVKTPTQVVLDFFVSSKTSLGAINKNSSNSYFEISIDNGFRIPESAYQIRASIRSGAIWNSVPTIVTGVNDQIEGLDGGVPYILTIPQGNYSLNELNTAIELEVVTEGLASGSISIAPFLPQSKTDLTLGAGVTITFDDSGNPRNMADLFGFNKPQTLAAATTHRSDNISSFNALDYFLISSDLVSDGIRTNNRRKKLLGKIDITAPPNSLINLAAGIPMQVFAPRLAGSTITSMSFELLDDELNQVIMPEDWHLGIEITYLV